MPPILTFQGPELRFNSYWPGPRYTYLVSSLVASVLFSIHGDAQDLF